MRWIRSAIGSTVGLAICALAFLMTSPANLCADREPPYNSSGYPTANFDISRAPLPFPAARCTTVWTDTGATTTALVVDWVSTALLALGVVVVALSLLTLRKKDEPNS